MGRGIIARASMTGAANTRISAAWLAIVRQFNTTVIARGGIKMIKVKVFWVAVMTTWLLEMIVIMYTRPQTVKK